MLFVVQLEVTGGTPEERIARRAQWQYPEGVKVIAEYWLQTDGYSVISILGAVQAALTRVGNSVDSFCSCRLRAA